MDLQKLIADYGAMFYAITVVWTFLEGETFVLFAGFAAAQGSINPLLLVLCAWIGSFFGDQLYFFIGKQYGVRLLERFPRWRSGVDMVLGWLKRYNATFILTFRFIYGVRNFASFTMGMSGLSWPRFLALNFVAAGIWSCAFVGAGYFGGHALGSLLGPAAQNFAIGMLGVFLAVVTVVMGIHKWRSKRKHRRAAARSGASVPLNPGPPT
ncbi:MAG TPA: DedA family protein [Stellaceae bacterium]|nr:DedA family protein [Stellaceae bacterium]